MMSTGYVTMANFRGKKEIFQEAELQVKNTGLKNKSKSQLKAI
jgi:hypothetical protein